MTRRLTLVLAIAFLASVGYAKFTLSDCVSDLELRVTERLDEIGPTPGTKAEKKEAKKLGKALDFLGAYLGNNDIADLKTLGKAIKQLYVSKTQDAEIDASVRTVLDCVIDLAQEKRGLADEVLAKLYDEKYRKGVMKLLDKADAFLQSSTDLRDVDAVKCQKMALKAWKTFVKSIGKGEKFEDKEIAATPDHLFISQSMFSLAIYNKSNKDHFVRDVLLTGEWRAGDGTVVATVDKASVAAVWPDHFKIDVFKDGNITSWDCQCMISRTYPGDPTQYAELWEYFYQYKDLAMPGTGSCAFFGTMVVVLTNHHTKGTTYRIPFTPSARYFD